MWLSGQQKRPAQAGEGQTGIVTIGGAAPAVQLESERRNLDLYGPGGYHWAPKAGQRVLVLKTEGEDPCVIGAKQGEQTPEQVCLEADQVELRGEILVNGIPLETYIATLVAGLMGG